jgi:predicted transposase/invertase (TIGR01784 family)
MCSSSHKKLKFVLAKPQRNMAKYINPYTDFGFKKLFGEEGNKALLMDFLNQLLPERHQIADLSFQNAEQTPGTSEERKAFFDIHCRSASGERFIVEMQKAKIEHFKDRALYYLTYPIRDQAQRGLWNFKLNAIYYIAVLDFWYEEEHVAKFHRQVVLQDQFGEVFYHKLGLIFLQMPAFNKTAEELETKFDKWAYFLKNLESLDAIPQILNEPVFTQAFNVAEISNLSAKQLKEYEKSWLTYIEMKEVTETAKKEAREEGFKEGREEGREVGREEGLRDGEEKKEREAVLGLVAVGIAIPQIAKALKISEERVRAITERAI